MAREGFVIYHEFLKWLEPYGDAERGRLLTAMLVYSSTGEDPRLSGNERYLWPAIKDKLDRDKESYENKCKQLAANGSKSHEKSANAAKSGPTKTETKTETGIETETKRETAHPHGEYGWVKLTDAQYSKLVSDFGLEEAERCINYVDQSAQQTGNKNKWKDWNLTVRKCHRDGWGRNRRSGDISGSYAMMEEWANE